MTSRLIIIIAAILISISSDLLPQSNLKVEHISLEEGISNNLIFAIYQDSKGFIWFGTMFGLVKYDGVNYKTFRYNPLDSNSISNDDVISICEDKDGFIWFGTFNGGLNKYDRNSGKFTRYIYDANNNNSISNNTVWSIMQDSKGAMWFGTEGGLCKFENGNFKAYSRDTSRQGSISGNVIRSIAEDREGNLWVGTLGAGLNKFDRAREFFTHYKNEKGNDRSLGNNFVSSIYPDKAGDLWIGTGGGGLNKFDKQKNEFARFVNDSANEKSISSSFVLSVKGYNDGELFIGTQNGLNLFDKSKGSFERIKIYPDKKNSTESIITFLKDQSGVMWVSTYLDGLHKLYFSEDKFKSILAGSNVKSIFVDKEGIIYAGTSEGLRISYDSGKTFIVFSKENKNSHSISSNVINSITEDSAGNIWIGTVSGLNKLDKASKHFQHYFNAAGNENSLSSNNINKVYFDKQGTLWIGTDNGLNKFIKESQSFQHFTNIRGNDNSLSENTVLSIYEDKENRLWIGTYKGLNLLNRETGKFKRIQQDPKNPNSISSNYIFSFCEDSNNNFWLGTGGGLNSFDRKSETFFHFSEKEGLANGVIAGIEEGNDGNLWLSTFKGISKFNIGSREFRNYDSGDGLLSNLFNTGSYFKTNDGTIFFGSVNGINYFNPSLIKENKFIPEIVLTTLTKFDGANKSEQDISSKSQIELSHNDILVSINFASLDYSNPGKNKYAYKLEGFDNDEWIYSGNTSEAVYTNLDPGSYIFKVKGTNSDGIWNENASSIKIIIHPPFYKTWWFYGLLALLFVGTIILIHNLRLKSKVKTLMQIEKIKERERELMREQASRDYHDELGHKLTRISLYSRRINKKLRPTANGLTEDLNSIIDTSNSLQSGAKDLIWTMNPKEDSLYDFAVRLRDFGNEIFENTGIAFLCEGIADEHKDIFLSMNSKRHLIYIFKEAMNNILKYAQCSEVRLNINSDGNELQILLTDNGIGFDINNCVKGYGLKNIFLRAEQLKIKLSLNSEKTGGTSLHLNTQISNLMSA